MNQKGPLFNNFTNSSLATSKAVCWGKLHFKRMPIKDTKRFMGMCKRSYVTGEIFVDERDRDPWPACTIVDLWDRPKLGVQVQRLSDDNYLFVPHVLAHRTWLYHDRFNSAQGLEHSQDHDEHSMIRDVLSIRCVDAP